MITTSPALGAQVDATLITLSVAVALLQADAHSLAAAVAATSDSQDADVAAITAPLKEGTDALANPPAARLPRG